jgi:3-hydroxy-9,10-secoandrosta-1,3,5(10)-triene-9,17-dione monooxygenase
MAGIDVSPEDERRFIRAGQQCVNLAWEAVDTMFHTSRTASAGKMSVLGRYFRNMAVIRTHAFAQSHHTSTNAGRLRFGLTPFGPV